MKNVKLRVAVLISALILVSPVLCLDAFVFAIASVINRHCTKPANIFYRLSDLISDRIIEPFFSLLGLWEDKDPCS